MRAPVGGGFEIHGSARGWAFYGRRLQGPSCPALQAMGNIQRADYNAKSDIDVRHPNWMKSLPDERLLRDLFIPGTHDTCSLYGGDAIQCQSLTLPKQLRAGIRYLDIRLRHFNDTLPVHHGLKFQDINFTGVLRACREFLEEEPSEGIMMRVKQEYQAANNKTGFDQLVKGTCLSVLGARWFVDNTGKLEAVTLGQLRGKILILQQYQGERAPGAFGYGALDIQDSYSLPTVFHIKSHLASDTAKRMQVSDICGFMCPNGPKPES